MVFHPCERDLTCSTNIESWASENDKYRLELNRVIFGYRVKLRLKDDWSYILDYCAGADTIWIDALVNVLKECLRHIPESYPHYRLSALFPMWEIRPMYKDETCWNALLDLGKVPTRDLMELSELDICVGGANI